MKKNKKNTILRTAARCFADQGYERTSIERIAREAEVALGLVRYHFATKERLYFEVSYDVMVALRDRLIADRNPSENTTDAVRRFVRTYMKFTSDPKNYYSLIYQESPFKILKDPQFLKCISSISIDIIECLKDIISENMDSEQALRNATIITASLHGIQRARISPKLNDMIKISTIEDFFSKNILPES